MSTADQHYIDEGLWHRRCVNFINVVISSPQHHKGLGHFLLQLQIYLNIAKAIIVWEIRYKLKNN